MSSFCRLLEPRAERIKSSILELILSTSGAIGRKCSNLSFWRDFWRQGQKVLKSTILEFILLTSGACCRKCSNLSFWNTSCILLEPLTESAQIDRSGAHFVDFWSHWQKLLKSIIPELILSTSGAKGRKCSNRAFWEHLRPSGGIWLNLWMCVHTLERLILQTLQSVVQK